MDNEPTKLKEKTVKNTLLAAGAAALVAFMGYLGVGDAEQSERIRAVEVRQEGDSQRLERIELKVDRLLEK